MQYDHLIIFLKIETKNIVMDHWLYLTEKFIQYNPLIVSDKIKPKNIRIQVTDVRPLRILSCI